MIYYGTSTTARLEGYARANYGLNLGIVVSPDNASGKYFAVNQDDRPLRNWISLGWTADEARERIARLSADN
jgi:hypothetical protein